MSWITWLIPGRHREESLGDLAEEYRPMVALKME